MTPTIIIICAILVLTVIHILLNRRPRPRAPIELSLDEPTWQSESGAGLTGPMMSGAAASFGSETPDQSESEPDWENEPDFEVEMAPPPEPRYRPANNPAPQPEPFEQIAQLEEVEELEE